MALMILTGLSACKAKSEESTASQDETNMLVCYFSATGTTADAAKRIAELAGADLYEITPEIRYSEADLDWTDSLSRSYIEMHDSGSRPAIVDTLPDMKKYNIVFIGYPNWWNSHPKIINTFIEANDFMGKTIVPFMTSGGSDIANSEKELHESYHTLNFSKGLLMNDVTDDEIKEWIKNSTR